MFSRFVMHFQHFQHLHVSFSFHGNLGVKDDHWTNPLEFPVVRALGWLAASDASEDRRVLSFPFRRQA